MVNKKDLENTGYLSEKYGLFRCNSRFIIYVIKEI